MKKLLIAIDKSGSISDQQFTSAVNVAKMFVEHTKGYKIDVILFDHEITELSDIEVEQLLKGELRQYGGGSSILPVIDKASGYDKALICTDGHIEPYNVQSLPVHIHVHVIVD